MEASMTKQQFKAECQRFALQRNLSVDFINRGFDLEAVYHSREGQAIGADYFISGILVPSVAQPAHRRAF
jgi:hypothetical protein